jgi:hypothetical protein
MSKEPEAATIDGELGLRDRKKARTRQQILDVASELFAEMGYENARTAAIARRAEVSEATLFRSRRARPMRGPSKRSPPSLGLPSVPSSSLRTTAPLPNSCSRTRSCRRSPL